MKAGKVAGSRGEIAKGDLWKASPRGLETGAGTEVRVLRSPVVQSPWVPLQSSSGKSMPWPAWSLLRSSGRQVHESETTDCYTTPGR